MIDTGDLVEHRNGDHRGFVVRVYRDESVRVENQSDDSETKELPLNELVINV